MVTWTQQYKGHSKEDLNELIARTDICKPEHCKHCYENLVASNHHKEDQLTLLRYYLGTFISSGVIISQKNAANIIEIFKSTKTGELNKLI